MNIVEICIASDIGNELLARNIDRVFAAGAKRIELCSAMADDGLTPNIESIAIARSAMAGHSGLMVMIRPRVGDFCYSAQELELMAEQIRQVAAAGANGVVFGALNQDRKTLNVDALSQLTEVARALNLEVGIHRAFDAVNDQAQALQQLIELKVNRVLTSGGAWCDNSTALANIVKLKALAQLADKQIELVIAGGVASQNASEILSELYVSAGVISLHAHSGVLVNQEIESLKVSALVNAKASQNNT